MPQSFSIIRYVNLKLIWRQTQRGLMNSRDRDNQITGTSTGAVPGVDYINGTVTYNCGSA